MHVYTSKPVGVVGERLRKQVQTSPPLWLCLGTLVLTSIHMDCGQY
jgi:hypothetical protein